MLVHIDRMSPKRILLMQLDGKIPNIALMRVAAHHRATGDEVELRFGANFGRQLWDSQWDKVYASAIFEKTRPERLRIDLKAVV